MFRAIVPFIRKWCVLAFSVGTSLAFFWSGSLLFARLGDPFWLTLIFVWLFVAVLASALLVVHHADHLAEQLGEPFGTLILTLSILSIEVTSISAAMLHGQNNPTLARDTLFAVVMIILNGMVGLSLLMGGWRHREQHYNLQGANAYLGVIIPLVVFSLIMPNYTTTTPGPTLSGAQELFLVFMSVGLYCVFLLMQTRRHSGYFMLDGDTTARASPPASVRSVAHHAGMLIAYLIPVTFLAKQLAFPIDYFIETLQAPAPVGGVIIAILVGTPEAIGAVRAAMANHLQRSVNIFLGSILSTSGLTIPVVILISQFTGRSIVLGVEHTDLIMLLLTLGVSTITFASGRTNVIQGAVHLILFAAYLFFIVQS